MTKEENNNLPTNNLTTLAPHTCILDTPKYAVYTDEKGKKYRVTKYETFHSKVLETKDEQFQLYSWFNTEDHPDVIALKDAYGTVIEVEDFYTDPYEKFDIDEMRAGSGVRTLIIDKSGQVYITSSVSVYFSLMRDYKFTSELGLELKEQVIKGKSNKGNDTVEVVLVK